MLKQWLKTLARLAIIFSLFISFATFASAFQLWEQSAAGTGDYHAGGAAEADDASTEFYNPAGEIRIDHLQVSTGAVLIPVGLEFKGTVNGTSTPGFVYGGTTNLIPNFHLVVPVGSRFAFGFGATTPFGLRTDYAGIATNVVSLAATETSLLTINLNPSFAFAITHWVSIGAGFDVLYGSADYDALALGVAPFTNNLSGWGYGYNAGILFQITPETRIGASYRSEIKVDADGNSKFLTVHTNVSSTLPLPATTIISVYQGITERFSAMFSAYYTNWSAFTTLMLKNTAIGTLAVHDNYRNTWNFAFGLHYLLTQLIMLKAGFGYDQTPTKSGFQDVRLPDENRFAMALGIHVQPTPTMGLDVGWTHFFLRNAGVNNTQSITGNGGILPTVIGTAKLSANVIGAQFTWDVDI